MSRYLTYCVKPELDGKTVKQAAKQIFGISASLLKSMKRPDGILCNGNHCRTIDYIYTGDVVQFNIEDKGRSTITPVALPLTIVYEDEDVLLLDKCSGMSMHPSITEQEGTLANAVMHHFCTQGKYGVFHAVNRLDKDTSGLCLIAKNGYAHMALSEQIQSHLLRRRYYAIMHGYPEPESGKIIKPIIREEGSILRRTVSLDGKPAITRYRTLCRVNGCSLLEISLETGRTHQIRVHFSDAGHPLVGDWLYGNGDNERDLIFRHALHSCFIIFQHPVSKQFLSFHSPLPQDMRALLQM